MFDPSNPLVQTNQKLHSSALYNGLQISVNALAIFTGVATTTMTCFVAGTMILTVTGLVAIEKIQTGDMVISRNPETMEVMHKRVLETYIQEDTKLIHLVVNGEKITTTETHPFYVNKRGFVDAGELNKNKKDWSENLCGAYYCIDDEGELYELESDEGETLRLTYEQFAYYVMMASEKYISVWATEDEKLVIQELLQSFL